MIKFENDDEGLQRWWDENEKRAWVLNLPQNSNKSDHKAYMLHRYGGSCLPPNNMSATPLMTVKYY